jgi:hypothetical protein
MGYPFDRTAKKSDANLDIYLNEFLTENMKTQDVGVLHRPLIPIIPIEPPKPQNP